MKYNCVYVLIIILLNSCGDYKKIENELLILDISPLGGSISVPVNSNISVIFNNDIMDLELNNSLILSHGDSLIAGQYEIYKNHLSFIPNNNLSFSTSYTIAFKYNYIDKISTFTTCDTSCDTTNSSTAWMTNPKIIKTKKTFGEVVETTPIIFNENFLLVEFLREEKNGINQFSYRLRDINSDEILINKEWIFGLGSSIVIDEQIYLFGTTDWNDYDGPHSWSRRNNLIGLTILDSNMIEINTDTLFYSSETETFYNTSVCQSPDGFIMAYEVKDEGLSSFSIRFKKSTDLFNWETIGETLYSEKYAACPTIRYLDGYYYIFYLNQDGDGETYDLSTLLVRTNDFIIFEEYKGNQIFTPYVSVLSSNGFINEGNNNSDIDLVEHQGQTYYFYHSGGNLNEGRGVEKMAIYDGSFKQFIEEYWNK